MVVLERESIIFSSSKASKFGKIKLVPEENERSVDFDLFILVAFSKFLRMLLKERSLEMELKIFLPVQYECLNLLNELMHDGQIRSLSSESLASVGNVADILGIPTSSWKISKRKTLQYTISDSQNCAEEEEIGSKILHCEKCPQTFLRKDTFGRHMAKVHSLPSPIKTFHCKLCNKVYYRHDQFTVHSRSKKHKKKVDNLQESEKLKSWLEIVDPQVTLDFKRFFCKFCVALFSKKEALRRHMADVHEKFLKSKLFNCEVCLKTFYSLFNLKTHKKTDTHKKLVKRTNSDKTTLDSRENFKIDYNIQKHAPREKSSEF